MSAETQAPRSFSTMPPPPPASSGKISPSSALLFIIVFLAVIVFLSGLLHLLVRFLKKNRSFSSLNIIRSARYPEMSGSDHYQRRQLHHLFNLHDSGLDQVFIDALPIFQYKEIMGLKEPFDCAVCLCEFNDQEELRLLPLCSHAFHIDCIDTWLLSNSTCPLCRGALYNYTPGLPFENPVFEFQDSRDEDGVSSSSGDGFGVRTTGEKPADGIELEGEKRVFSVRLGKFKRSNNDQQWQGQGIRVGEVGQTSRSDLDTRRCYSMGSYQYVVSDSVNLQVALSPSGRDAADVDGGGSGNVLKPVGGTVGRTGDFITDGEAEQGKRIHFGSKNESFSVSKIWLWSKKGKFPSYSDAHVNMP